MILDSDLDILKQQGVYICEISTLLEDRLFIEACSLQCIDRLTLAIDNEIVREAFKCGLWEIMAEYPDSVKDDPQKTIQVLGRVAKLFEIESPMQTGWITHISGNDGAMSMLTLYAKDDNWYNIMACDDYIMIEKSKPSVKHILGLYGAAETGKTPTAKKVFHILKNKYPEHSIIFEDENRYDVKGLFFIGNAMVGFDSQGDPTGRQMDGLNDFVSIGCDVNFLCSRTDGRTVSAIEKFKHTHIINWEKRVYESNVPKQDEVNTKQAEHIVELIEQYASIV